MIRDRPWLLPISCAILNFSSPRTCVTCPRKEKTRELIGMLTDATVNSDKVLLPSSYRLTLRLRFAK